MTAVLDTNIVVDLLLGRPESLREVNRYERRAISVVTWIEVLAGARDGEDEAFLERFMSQFDLLEVDRGVARRAAELRRIRRIRLPDAVIWASALQAGGLLVTRNTRDFPRDEPGIRVPYEI